MILILIEALILFNALTTINRSTLLDEWFALFSLLYEKAVGTFKQDAHNLPPATFAETTNSLAYFPNWPVQCFCGSYQINNVNTKAAETCRKEKHSLMPEFFMIYCEHGMKIYKNNGKPQERDIKGNVSAFANPRHHGTTALRHHGTTALRHYGTEYFNQFIEFCWNIFKKTVLAIISSTSQ